MSKILIAMFIFASTTFVAAFDHDYTALSSPNTVMYDVRLVQLHDQDKTPLGKWRNLAYVAIAEGFSISEFYEANKANIEYTSLFEFQKAAYLARPSWAAMMDMDTYVHNLRTDRPAVLPMTKWHSADEFDIMRDADGNIVSAKLCNDDDDQNLASRLYRTSKSTNNASVPEEQVELNPLAVTSHTNQASVLSQSDVMLFGKYRAIDYLVGILSLTTVMLVIFQGIARIRRV